MLNTSTIESLVDKISHSLTGNGQTLADDLKKNLPVGLSAALQRMDLVTREEFDVQTALLARTRARLEALEEKVTKLEAEKAP